MQEDIEMRSVTMTVNASKFTGRTFARAVMALYRHFRNGQARKASKDVTPHGKQTVKELVGQNQGVTTIEVQDKTIKDFERIAKKYGVDFAIKKVKGQNKYLVFFKGRDTDALKAAFEEYTNKQMNREKRPSVRKMLRYFKEKVADRQRDPTRHRHQEQSL